MSSSGSREAVGCYDYECNEDVIELKALGLPKIISTQKHKIPVYRKGLAEVAEIEAKDIRKGDYILTGFQRDKTGQDSVEINAILGSNPTNPSRPHPRTKLLPPSVKIDNKFLRLFGLYLAEGHAHKNTASWSYSVQEENTLVVETENLIRDIFGLETRREVFNNGIKVCCDSQTLSAFFKYLSGGGSNRRRIATEIFNSPASLLPLVGGWFDGDGSVHNYSKTIITEVASTSKDLIFQMYSILLDEKIPTNYRMQRRDGNHSDIHKLTLDRVSANLLSPFSIKINYKEGATSRQGFWFGDKFLRPIKKISRSPYKGKVYDLAVEEDHHYQVNGIIVHNTFWEYDPRRTMQQAPQPVYPPDYPKAALEERQQQIAEMEESIAGTEDILRGQRPTGVNSAAMLEAIRRQALASRSPTLQTWDESLESTGGALLQETIKHIRNDARYAERLRIIAREKASRVTIENFSGTDLSDNVQVRVDTASMAYNAQEAKQARAVELLQYGQTLAEFPPTLRKSGYPDAFVPQGSDITRVQTLIGWVKQNRFDLVIPFREDDPYVFHEFLVEELKSEAFIDHSEDQKKAIMALIEL
jgi:intein/homing endonuclease